jgi:hypothetical protein
MNAFWEEAARPARREPNIVRIWAKRARRSSAMKMPIGAALAAYPGRFRLSAIGLFFEEAETWKA